MRVREKERGIWVWVDLIRNLTQNLERVIVENDSQKKKKKKTNIIESDSKACTEPILGLGQNCPLRSSSWSYIVCNLAKAFGVCIFNWVCIGS